MKLSSLGRQGVRPAPVTQPAASCLRSSTWRPLRLSAPAGIPRRPAQASRGAGWQRPVLAAAQLNTGDYTPITTPSETTLKLWQSASAVCFDVDCELLLLLLLLPILALLLHRPPAMPAGTITVQDSLDLLAEFMGVKDAVTALTNRVRISAWDGAVTAADRPPTHLTSCMCRRPWTAA
jgi:hypothetical protein